MRVIFALALIVTPAIAGVHWVESGGASGDFPSKPTNHATQSVTYTIGCNTAGVGTNADIQGAVDDRWRGDTIQLDPKNSTSGIPCVWKFISGFPILLRADLVRAGLPADTYTRLVPTNESALPPRGVRLTPYYRQFLPTLMSQTSVAGGESVPVIAAPAGLPALTYFEMRGINITIDPGSTGAFVPPGVTFGPSMDSSWYPGHAYSAMETSDVVKFAGTNGACGKLVCAGDTTFTVAAGYPNNNGDPTQYLSVGMKLCIGNKTTNTFEYQNNTLLSHPDCQVITALTPTTITVDPSTPMLYDHTVADHIELRVSDVGESMLPDHIRIQQCIFSSDFLHLTIRMLALSTRYFELLDSFVDGAVGDNRAGGKTDSQGVWTGGGPGPYMLENNYIYATGENYMDGGSAAAMDTQASGIQRRNYFPKVPERDWTGPWGWVLDPTLKWTAQTRFGSRLVFKGRTVHRGLSISSGLPYWQALNTGVACATEPTDAKWTGTITPVAGDTVDDCGVKWSYLGLGFRKMIKNNWELKKGKGILLEYNVMDNMYDGYTYNAQQTASINIKASSQPDGQRGTKGCGAGKVWPDCQRARTAQITIRYNTIKTAASFLLAMGGQLNDVAEAQDWNISNNLWIQDTPSPVTASLTPTGSIPLINVGGYPTVLPKLSGLKIDKNTFYVPFSGTDVRTNSQPLHVEGTPVTFPQGTGNSFSGNILVSRFWNGFHSSCSNAASPGIVPKYLWPNTVTTTFNCNGTDYVAEGGGKFDNNIIIGAQVSNYTTGTVVGNNCTALNVSCPESWVTPGGIPLFRNRNTGNFVIDDAYAVAKATMPDGGDIGVDFLRQPLMNDYQVLVSDKQILLKWTANPPIGVDRPELGWRDTPCVVEVMNSPDLEAPLLTLDSGSGSYLWTPDVWKNAAGTPRTNAYLAEWSNFAHISAKDLNGYNYDSDMHNRNVRRGLERTFIIGQQDNLAPNTDVWGRAMCGGDVRWFDVTTLATLTGTGKLNGTGITEWGTVYSRATDTITDSHVVTGGSATGVTKGIVYYRQAGRVQVTLVK